MQSVAFCGEEGDDTFEMSPTVQALLTMDGGVGFDKLKVERNGATYKTPLPSRGQARLMNTPAWKFLTSRDREGSKLPTFFVSEGTSPLDHEGSFGPIAPEYPFR